MRLVELSLERYGVFDQRTLAFGDAPGLTVIYGANEAGKSTSLAALTDFLFTVPHFSPHSAIYGGDALRIGAVLRGADGAELTLRRRKGRGRTLTDGAGASVEEPVLSALLGGTTRERFETLFGLDHERLRQGGAQLLTAEGDIGRLIIEAGGGLRGLVERLSHLDAQIDLLFDTRRSEKRAFYRALDAYNEADKDVKEGTVSLEQYDRLSQASDAAKAALEGLTGEQAALSLAAARLERLVRVAPLLRELDRVRHQLGDRVPLPDLPDDFEAQVRSASEADTRTTEAAEASQVRLRELEARSAALVVDDVVGSLEADVRDAAEASLHVIKARDDRANRLKELTESNQQLDGLRRRLGVGPQDDLAARLPAPETLEGLQQLVSAAQRREPAVAAALQRTAELQTDLARLTEAVAVQIGKGHDQSVGVGVAELVGLPSAVQAHEQQTRAADAVLSDVSKRAHALGYETLEILEGEPFPAGETLTQESIQRDALNSEQLRLVTQRTDAETLLSGARDDIARLTAGVDIATDEALDEARRRRGEALSPLRSAHLAGSWAASAAQRANEVDMADASLRAADELADRHAAEAQRAAEFAQANRQLEKAKAAIAAAGQGLQAVGELLATREQALAIAFPLAIGRFSQLEALRAAQLERSDILRQWKEARGRRHDMDQAQAAFGAQLELLALAERVCGVVVQSGASIAERVRNALTAVRERETAHAEHRRDVGDLQKAGDALAAATESLGRLRAEEAQWRAAWEPVVVAVGLPADVTVDAAAAAGLEWAAARGVLTTIEQTTRRLRRMDQDETSLQSAVAAMGVKLGLALPKDAVAAAKMLDARWAENARAQRDREQLLPDVAAARDAAARAASASEHCREVFAGLSRLAGLQPTDVAGMHSLCQAHGVRMRLRAQEARSLESLATAGDQLPEAQLREAWDDRDLDEIAAELETTRARARDADTERVAAVEAAMSARQALSAIQEQAGVNAAVAAREASITELHNTVERYIDLSLARDLIKSAIDKVRARQQDPLVARAGALFQAMTQGAYVSVGADIDAKGQPIVVGQARGGANVMVSEMSDGTRDQLYLAFRLAGVENYCRAAEPLPFVADDILVHFDDARGAATLEVLADFGSTTQVLLFTHHQAVREAADTLAKAGRARIVDLT